MKVQKRSGKDERLIVTAMIVNNQVLGRIASKYDEKMFPSPWANLVGGWCVDYFTRYKKAPRKNIEHKFDKWAGKHPDKATVEIVEKFVQSLSRQYDEESHEINVDYVIDVAGVYFNTVQLKKALQEASDQLEQGDYEKADERIHALRKIELGVEADSNPYQELDVHKRTFEKQAEPLITYEGAIGKFFGNHLCRDGFIAFQGPEKGKKSFWMLDIVHRGVRSRRKVFYIQVGDMSEDQITTRLQARLCLRPVHKGKWKYPIDITYRKDGPPKLKHEKHREKQHLTLGEIKKAQTRFNETWLRSRKTQFLKMYCTPTLSMLELQSRIERYIDIEGWIPDIVVLDYIDLVDAPRSLKEPRDQINHNWRQARIISQKYHLLFVTGTQANAQAYKRESQDRSSFSNDKRKMAHVTGIIGLNQNSDTLEKLELMKLNWAVPPRGSSKPNPVWCAGCLAIANPVVLSC